MTAAELFADAIRRCLDSALTVADLLPRVEQLAAAGETALVESLYESWIRASPGDPLLHAVHFNLGTVQSEREALDRAAMSFREAIRLRPDFAAPYINLGNVLERQGARDQAIATWLQATEILQATTAESLTYKVTALKQIGRVLETARIEGRAEQALRQCLELDARHRDVIQHFIALRQVQCVWPAIEPVTRLQPAELVREISPLSLACHVDDPLWQLGNAHHYSRAEIGAIGAAAKAVPAAPRSGPLRIGYLSSDLREHAVGFLTAEVFGLHDRRQVQVHAYYCGIPSADDTHQRIKGSVDHWVDISGLADDAAAARMRADGIDILVDLNGYTKDARLKLVARRPAPVIVNWLGYPGSMGSPHHDYIVADPWIIPPGAERFYSERVKRLSCYQPTDRQRVIASQRPNRGEAGLPDDAVVFCCFNGTQKITQTTFATWMRILDGVPGSVLWLLSATDETNARLRARAAELGIAPERIVFAERRRNAEHLARYPLADLCLDTFPYGAHTTASDALWMGVPMLTLSGRSFAARVCGSLVRAASLPQLVCEHRADYLETAIALGRDPAALRRLSETLRAGRENAVLFDTPRLVHELERLYCEMWQEACAGTAPKPDLSHLALLYEIGCADGGQIPHELPLEAYLSRYRDAATKRHEFAALNGVRLAASLDNRQSCDGVGPRASAAAPHGAGRLRGSSPSVEIIRGDAA